MPVYDKYNFLLLPKMLVLNPKDGTAGNFRKIVSQLPEQIRTNC